MQAHISSHKMKGDRIPCGDSRESHSPPALLDRGPHIFLTHREVRWVHCFKRWRPEIYFLTVIEVGGLRSGLQYSWFLMRVLFLHCRSLLTASPHGGKKAGKLSGISSYTAPIYKSSSKLSYIPKSPVPKTMALGVKTSAYEFQGLH